MAELSPLRRRTIEDMTVRNLPPATQRSYIDAVQKFSRHFGRSRDRLDLDDVHAFQVHLISTGIDERTPVTLVAANVASWVCSKLAGHRGSAVTSILATAVGLIRSDGLRCASGRSMGTDQGLCARRNQGQLWSAHEQSAFP